MEDLILKISGVIFCFLFLFLSSVFVIFLVSRFISPKYKNFEPKISIIVPACNEEKNIKLCIYSILDSNYNKEKLEIIVVDDGSNDKTTKIVHSIQKNLKSTHPRIILLEQEHLGKVEALNKGMSKSSNEFILTLDADTTLDKNCIKELVKPFNDRKIAATTGNNVVKNNKTIITTFQNIEYHFINLISTSFSTVFRSGLWFSGSLGCYRKKALSKVGYFKKDTLAEDQDVALELKRRGYKTMNVLTAFGFTIVPETLNGLYKQRMRWWIGTLQSIFKNKKMFVKGTTASTYFLAINQFWWSFYAFLSLPLIIYQINYWLPYNSGDLYSITSYFFRWFSLMGPIYSIYKIPEWGISMYSIFGILSGIITMILSISALKLFKDRITFKNLLAIFFYFPYTIVLNIIILVSLIRNRFWIRSFYLK